MVTAATGFALRPYQLAALEAVRDRHADGARRMLLVAATGAGKTVVFSHLADALQLQPDEKVLILAHRDELVTQAREKYLTAHPGELIGIEKGNACATPMDRVAVASVQTLRGRRLESFLRRFGMPKLVITDEAHHAPAAGYQEVYNALKITRDGEIVHVGVTATPKRSDKIGLSGTFDVIAHTVGIEELIEGGYLVPLVGYTVQTTTSLDAVRTTAGDFNQGDLEDAVNTPERNAQILAAYQDLAPGRKAILFAASVEHSIDLGRTFIAAGIPAIHVDGAMSIESRRFALASFAAGRHRVLTNCQVATEGYDEPSVDCVIIARPTKSPVLMTQMIGRCTRLHPGKDRGIVIDLVDVTKRHSVVTLPSLFGMPATFDLEGKSATEVAKKFAEVVRESPEMEGMLTSVTELDAAAKLSANERFAARLTALLEKARSTQTYVDVNLLRPPDLDESARAETRLNWVPTADDSYLLRIDCDTIRIHADLVGKHSVNITRRLENQSAERDLGGFYNRAEAFEIADDWVRRNHPDKTILVDRDAGWRDSRPSEKQISTLLKFRVANPEKLTRGKASELLDLLFSGIKRRKTA